MEGLQPPARLKPANPIDSRKDNKSPAVYNGQAGGSPAWKEYTQTTQAPALQRAGRFEGVQAHTFKASTHGRKQI